MQRAANQPVSELTVFAGIFCKTWAVPDAGTLLPQHSHEFPHLSMIVAGAVRVWCEDGLLGDFEAPATVKIEARERHSFLTLTDGVVIACIHAMEDGEDPAIHAEHHLVEG